MNGSQRGKEAMMIGLGYDAHRLVTGRDLVIGGVVIDYEKGLLGHSDGDVLCHAIADAILGAANLGDIGDHFPPGDPQWTGISGPVLLAHVSEFLAEHDLSVQRVDATLILEAPKISPYKERMRELIADALRIENSAISIKASTNEGMGFVGRGEGAAAISIAVVG